jgi:hypothetical protein
VDGRVCPPDLPERHGYVGSYVGVGVIRITDQGLRLKLAQAERIAFFIHEAFHGTPAAKLVQACDAGAFGAYGTTSTFLRNVAHYCTTCSLDFRRDAEEVGKQEDERIIQRSQAELIWREF